VKTPQGGVPKPEYVQGRSDEVYGLVIAIAYVDDTDPTFVVCGWKGKVLSIVGSFRARTKLFDGLDWN